MGESRRLGSVENRAIENEGRANAPMNRPLAILLAMAMFVLVVDTSIMNVSISAVVRDLGRR
jgi:hypothetical protein